MATSSEVPSYFEVDWERLLYNDDILDAAAYFFRDCVWTRDESAEGRYGRSRVYKRFPWDSRPDLREITEFKLTHGGLFMELGSRKTMKTWKEAARYAFLGLTQEARLFMIGSTKEERADMNIQRIAFIINTLLKYDQSKFPKRPVVVSRPAENLQLSNGTIFANITQNINDLTQITASGIWQDEITKLDDSVKAGLIANALASTQQAVGEVAFAPGSGTSLTGTCEGEERFWRMMFPSEESTNVLISPYEDEENREGLRCPENGLRIWSEGQVHRILFYYFADPGKVPGSDWYRRERPKWVGNEDAWNREMEIWPVADTEFKVTPEYKDGRHRRSFEELVELYQPNRPLVIGWDIGARFQCATVTQLNPRTGRIIVFMQIFQDNTNLENFGRSVVEYVKADFPNATAYHVGDPRSLSTSTGTAFGDLSEVLNRAGVFCNPAPGISIQRKVSTLKKVLSDYISGEPKLLIAGDRCKELVAGLRGKYKFQKNGQIPKRDGVTEHVVDSLVFCLLQHEYLSSEEEGDSVLYYPERETEHGFRFTRTGEVPAL